MVKKTPAMQLTEIHYGYAVEPKQAVKQAKALLDTLHEKCPNDSRKRIAELLILAEPKIGLKMIDLMEQVNKEIPEKGKGLRINFVVYLGSFVALA